jgi:transposase
MITRSKKTAHASEQERDDVKAAREAWFEGQDNLDIGRLFFIDECGTNTKMARSRGRSRRGERCRAAIPHGHWKTTTLVAALTTSGIAAPMILDGAMDGDMFCAYITHILLKELRPGDVVIMDNLPAHKVGAVREIIEGAGVKLIYLPPYSPDFNPIEKAFSQIKAYLKKVAARTKEKLDQAIAKAIDIVSAQNAINYFATCGYQSDTV